MSKGLKDFEAFKKIVVGEGPSDCHFLQKFCEKHDFAGFQFGHAGLHDPSGQPGGWEHFGDLLRLLPSLPKFEQISDIAVFCDTGDEPAKRFTALKAQIEAISVAVPDGTVTYIVVTPNSPSTTGQPRLHVFMVPSVDGKGGLESLCLQAASKIFDDQDKSIMAAVDEFSGKVCKMADGKLWTTEKTDKLRLQAFISAATPRKPDAHFYQLFNIAGDKLVPLDSDAFDGIKAFLSAIAAL